VRAVLGPRKTIEQTLAAADVEGSRLRRELGAFDLFLLGVGVIVGAGIFVLTGTAAAGGAGPAISVSFAVAAVVCALSALCYAEFSAMVPAAGSAYTYAYATVGQLVAFIIGWDLVLEFTIGASAVAVGFAGYLDSLLDQVFGVTLPEAIAAPPGDGGSVNVFAIAVVALVGALLVRGVRLSARFNTWMVALTVLVLLVVIVVGGSEIRTANWEPFNPGGWDGIVDGAAVVFFAYIGFDIVATTAEEARRPQRDLPIGILGSLALVTVLYVAVALVVTGMRPFAQLDSAAPVADAFKAADRDWIAAFVYAGALVAILNTVLVLMLGQSRVAFAMARDRLLPARLGTTHPRWGTPHRVTLLTVGAVAALAGFVPLTTLAELVSIGTLFAFSLVAAGVLVLRRSDPGRERPFRVPALPVVALGAIAGCVYLATKLDGSTWVRFLVWMALGLVVYTGWSRHRALAGRA